MALTGLRIGIDATTWWNLRGFGRFTRLLVSAMLDRESPHQFVLFVDRPPEPEMLRPNVHVVHVKTAQTVTEGAVSEGSRSIRDLLAFRTAARHEKLDVFYFPTVYSWYPTGRKAPVVVTFHDAIAERYTDLVLPHRIQRALWHAKTWLAKREAARITTVTNSAREEIVKYLKIPPEHIAVILEAADPLFRPVEDVQERAEMRVRLGLDRHRRYILYVGGIAPHKNLLNFTRAFALAIQNEAAKDLQLVIAGDFNGDGFYSNYAELRELAESDPDLSDRMHFPGFVAEADLPILYSDALAVTMPAFSEGFGLPAVEAISCGTPVMATAGGAVAEVIGEAGLYFDPYSIDDMARAITTIASDPLLEKTLRVASTARAAKFDWNKSADAMLHVLASAARDW